MSRLPPVNLLLAVEAATRLGSFKLAADELHLTPSAVSHRIKSVEAQLGSPLFKRVGQGIEPLANAREIAKTVMAATRSLQNTWDKIQASHAGDRLNISSVSAFASHFVLPNISGMQSKFRNASFELTSRNDLSELDHGLHDVVIRSGPIPSGGAYWSETILEVAFLPIVSPRLKSRAFSKGVLHGPLFAYHTAPDLWERVAPMLDVTLDPSAKIVKFETFESACDAASDGIGIALVPEWIAAAAIATGSVVPLVQTAIRPNWHYWIATRKGEETLPALAAFRQWIQQQIYSVIGDGPDYSTPLR